jgi:hypothetical protein
VLILLGRNLIYFNTSKSFHEWVIRNQLKCKAWQVQSSDIRQACMGQASLKFNQSFLSITTFFTKINRIFIQVMYSKKSFSYFKKKTTYFKKFLREFSWEKKILRKFLRNLPKKFFLTLSQENFLKKLRIKNSFLILRKIFLW